MRGTGEWHGSPVDGPARESRGNFSCQLFKSILATQVPDPTTGRGQGVDGISFTVHPPSPAPAFLVALGRARERRFPFCTFPHYPRRSACHWRAPGSRCRSAGAMPPGVRVRRAGRSGSATATEWEWEALFDEVAGLTVAGEGCSAREGGEERRDDGGGPSRHGRACPAGPAPLVPAPARRQDEQQYREPRAEQPEDETGFGCRRSSPPPTTGSVRGASRRQTTSAPSSPSSSY